MNIEDKVIGITAEEFNNLIQSKYQKVHLYSGELVEGETYIILIPPTLYLLTEIKTSNSHMFLKNPLTLKKFYKEIKFMNFILDNNITIKSFYNHFIKEYTKLDYDKLLNKVTLSEENNLTCIDNSFKFVFDTKGNLYDIQKSNM